MEGCFHGWDPMLEQGQSVSSPAAEEQGEADDDDELTTAGAGEDIEKSCGVKE